MTKYLILWHSNPIAPWPTDPAKHLELEEMIWVGFEGLMKKGEVKEIGYFSDVTGGYIVGEGDAATLYKDVLTFQPYFIVEAHEIISFETHKAITRAVLKGKIELTK